MHASPHPDVLDMFDQYRGRLTAAAAGGKPSVRSDEGPGPSPYLSVTVRGTARAQGSALDKELARIRAARASSDAASESTLVADVAERLGLPRDASEQDVLTALEVLDTKPASARSGRPQKSAEDSMFDRVFGRAANAPAPAPAPIALTDDEAFKRVFGR
jgi:hypothetical protein